MSEHLHLMASKDSNVTEDNYLGSDTGTSKRVNFVVGIIGYPIKGKPITYITFTPKL